MEENQQRGSVKETARRILHSVNCFVADYSGYLTALGVVVLFGVVLLSRAGDLKYRCESMLGGKLHYVVGMPVCMVNGIPLRP